MSIRIVKGSFLLCLGSMIATLVAVRNYIHLCLHTKTIEYPSARYLNHKCLVLIFLRSAWWLVLEGF